MDNAFITLAYIYDKIDAHSLSVYGHRMVSYKGNAYIYGGNYS